MSQMEAVLKEIKALREEIMEIKKNMQFKPVLVKSPSMEKHPQFILKPIDRPNSIKPYQTDRIGWEKQNHILATIKEGDRVIMYDPLTKKVHSIATVILDAKNTRKNNPHPLNPSRPYEVTIRYDVINKAGIEITGNSKETLTREEFDELYTQVVRGY